MKWITFDNSNIEKYTKFVESHPYSGIWHYPSWLELQKASKKAKDGLFFGIEDNNKIVLAGLILICKLVSNLNYAYIPAGFLYNSLNDDIYNFFLTELTKITKKKKYSIYPN